VLVNSTGIFRVKPFEEESEEDFEEALDSILRPTFYVSQAAVPEMRQRIALILIHTRHACTSG
jgi:NAD(P)-dependent dehydrogenase (short-subunit alcohol dehydrogenase family)